MKKVINGCIYAIDLGGTEEYEFKGVHPAMVVNVLCCTLNDVYKRAVGKM